MTEAKSNMVIGGLILASLFVFSSDHASAQKPATAADTHFDNGRFQIVPPAPNWENFVWVMDTRTGQVKAYRFVGAGTPGGFRIQEVPSIPPPTE
jgi:hypothetical protein